MSGWTLLVGFFGVFAGWGMCWILISWRLHEVNRETLVERINIQSKAALTRKQRRELKKRLKR